MFPVLLTIMITLLSTIYSATQVILVRHGETDWNKERRIQGSSDIPLNQKGLQQASQFSETFLQDCPPIAAIYSSDLCRAQMTAAISAQKLQLPVHTKKEFREMHFGDLEGLKDNEPVVLSLRGVYEELTLQYPDRKTRWNMNPVSNSETYNQVVQRMKEGLLAIAKENPHQTVLVFSHGKAMGLLLADLTDSNDIPKFGNCDVAYVQIDDSQIRVLHEPLIPKVIQKLANGRD